MGYDGWGMMGYGSGIGWITILLVWTTLGFCIAALWKYTSKK